MMYLPPPHLTEAEKLWAKTHPGQLKPVGGGGFGGAAAVLADEERRDIFPDFSDAADGLNRLFGR